MDSLGASRWWRRVGLIGVLVVLAGTLGVADAAAKKATKKPVAAPPYYTLKGKKQKCRAHYTKVKITIKVRKHHRIIRIRQTRCVYNGSKGTNGTTVSFPTNLPTAAIAVTVIPAAGDASYTIAAGQVLVVGGAGVLTGSSGSGLSASVVSGTTHGTLTLNHDGTFRYAPVRSFSGVDSFTFKAGTSSGENSTPATVTIHVTPVAVAVGAYYLPVSGTLSVAAPGVLAGDTGSGLKAKLVSGASGGLLALNADGSFTYTPTPNFKGSDSFTFEAVDSSGQASGVETVTIEIGVQAPSVVAESFAGAVGNTAFQVGGSRGSSPKVYDTSASALDGDSDPNGGTLSTMPGTITTAEGGSVNIAADGTFNYQPPTGFAGPSDSFIYQVNTSEETSALASATIYFGTTRVWYVNNSSAAAGDGSSVAPFDLLSTAVGAADPNDVIFLFGSSTPYTGGETLGADETLFGPSAGLTVNYENLLDASSGPSAQITSSGTGLTLTGGDELDGVTVEHTTGDGVSMGDGAFVIQNVTITDAGVDGISAVGKTSLTVTGSTITGSGADGIYVDDGNGLLFQNFNLLDNIITGAQGAAISLSAEGSANGNIDGNVIGIGNTTSGTVTAGSGSVLGDGIDLKVDGGAAWLYADVFNNDIYGVAAGSGIDADASAGGTLQLPLTANVVYTDATSPGNGMTISAGTSSSDTGTVCVDTAGNTLTAGGSGNGIEVEEPDAASSFGIQGYVASSGFAGVAPLLGADNPGSSGGGAIALATPNGATFSSCTVQQPDI